MLALFEKITVLQKFNPDDLYNTFLGLDKKRQVGMAVGLLFGVLLLLYLPVSFVSQKLDEKKREFDKYAEKAAEFYGTRNEFNQLQNSFDKIQQNLTKLGTDFLSTTIYNLAEEIDIPKNKIELKSISLAANDTFQEVGKDVQMMNVPYDQLMRFLNRLQNYDMLPLTIKKLSIKPDANKRQIMHQINFTVTTIKPNKS